MPLLTRLSFLPLPLLFSLFFYYMTTDVLANKQEHNKRCYIELEPLLRDDKRALKWLKREAERGIGLAGPVSVPLPGVNQAGIHIEWD